MLSILSQFNEMHPVWMLLHQFLKGGGYLGETEEEHNEQSIDSE